MTTLQRFTLRLPEELHDKIRDEAVKNRRSIHAQILWLIEQGLPVRTIAKPRPVPFCTCGHSLFDHAVEKGVDPLTHDLHGECFVGGCGCGRWHRDT